LDSNDRKMLSLLENRSVAELKLIKKIIGDLAQYRP
jgi:hypothetical protein